jgi:hypothetical protein
LKVNSIPGEDIARLVEGVRQAGSYCGIFVGTDLRSGTYFCKLTAGNFVDVNKVMLLK